MSEKCYNVAEHTRSRGDEWTCIRCCSMVANLIHPDLLHHRGRLCYKLYLKHRANAIATLQYATFILFVGLSGHNAGIFVSFSEAADFDLPRQLLFVAISWGLDTLNFTVTNVLCKRAYDITPIYCGTALLKQYPNTRRRLLYVAAHIISDVYLGMVFAMEGGIYWASPLGDSAAHQNATLPPASTQVGD